MVRQKKIIFLVATIKSIIIVKINFKNYSCKEFYNILLKDTKLRDEISLAQEYTKIAKKKKINQLLLSK